MTLSDLWNILYPQLWIEETKLMSKIQKQVVSLAHSTEFLPADIDFQLHKAINNYTAKSGQTYATLARDIDEFVRHQYKGMWYLVEDGSITQNQLEKHIKDHTPSRSYLHDYAKGRPICFRYTNTIANFFNVKYTIHNFDPSQDLKLFLDLTVE